MSAENPMCETHGAVKPCQQCRAEKAEAEVATLRLDVASVTRQGDVYKSQYGKMREALLKVCTWAAPPEAPQLKEEWRRLVVEVRAVLAPSEPKKNKNGVVCTVHPAGDCDFDGRYHYGAAPQPVQRPYGTAADCITCPVCGEGFVPPKPSSYEDALLLREALKDCWETFGGVDHHPEDCPDPENCDECRVAKKVNAVLNPQPSPCCEHDHDKDGNCDRHRWPSAPPKSAEQPEAGSIISKLRGLAYSAAQDLGPESEAWHEINKCLATPEFGAGFPIEGATGDWKTAQESHERAKKIREFLEPPPSCNCGNPNGIGVLNHGTGCPVVSPEPAVYPGSPQIDKAVEDLKAEGALVEYVQVVNDGKCAKHGCALIAVCPECSGLFERK